MYNMNFSNIQEILDRNTGYKFDVPGVRLPKIIIPEDDLKSLNLEKETSNYDFLRALSRRGFLQLKLKKDSQDYKKYQERAKYELQTFEELGFTDYILLCWDIINWCKKNGVPTGLGRGCLTYDSQVLTKDGYKSLGEVKIGDCVINSSGQWDEVIDTHIYDCDEELISFKTQCDTFSEVAMTKDHKILGMKDPFKRDSSGHVKSYNNLDLKQVFSEKNLIWDKADNFNKLDYFVRYIGRTNRIKDIESIDLAKFADRYDDDFVYEDHQVSDNHPLCINQITRESKISSNCLRSIKSGHVNKKRNSRYDRALNKLNEYLCSNGFSFNDFIDFPSKVVKKIPRYLFIDEKFCYVLGFFIGDGWVKTKGSSIGFAFNSEKDLKQLQAIKEYFKDYLQYENWSKKKKLVQLILNSKILKGLFSNLCEKKTNGKEIPSDFMNLPDNKLRSLLSGLIDSDGCRSKDRVSFDSTSINLINQARWLFEYFGYACSVSRRYQENYNVSYKIKANYKHTTSQYFNNGKYLFIKILNKNTKKNDSNKVYDITVKNNPSYSTDKFIVHNSCSGSLIMYLIGVTGIDPIKHNLYFERFVSKTRAKKQVIDGVTYLDGSLAPDVDSDICLYRRKEVINYLKDKYNGNLSGILQFNTLSGKLLIKECGKSVGNKSENEMKEVAEHIDKVFGKVEDLEHAYNNERDSNFKNWCDRSSVNKKIYNISLKLRDLIKNKSCHPSGYLISYNPLVETIATETIKPKAEDGEKDETERRLVCSADMATASLVAIKVDLLGLKNVSIVKDICGQIGIDIKDININDEFIYQQYQDLKYPKGLFQIEANTNYKVLKKVKPKNINELSAVLGLARPGALSFVDQYASYTNHGFYSKIHPIIDDILEKTGGVCIYQETVMQMFTKIGFSLAESETIRRVIGKKKQEEVLEWKDKIYNKCKENKIDKTVGDLIWKICSDSASYQFNKCLSPDTVVETPQGDDLLFNIRVGDKVLAYDIDKNKDHYVEVVGIHNSKVELFEVEFEDGRKIKCSKDHKFLNEHGRMMPLREILDKKYSIVCKD